MPTASAEKTGDCPGFGYVPAAGQDLLPVVDDFDGGGSLVRIHADDDGLHCVVLDQSPDVSEEGSATSSTWADPS
jgi:hypothetical protein